MKKKNVGSKTKSKGLFLCKKCGRDGDNPIEMCKAKPSGEFAKRFVKPKK